MLHKGQRICKKQAPKAAAFGAFVLEKREVSAVGADHRQLFSVQTEQLLQVIRVNDRVGLGLELHTGAAGGTDPTGHGHQLAVKADGLQVLVEADGPKVGEKGGDVGLHNLFNLDDVIFAGLGKGHGLAGVFGKAGNIVQSGLVVNQDLISLGVLLQGLHGQNHGLGAGQAAGVTTNNYLGGLEGTNILIRNGHKEIACIQGT